ncbi:ATP-binding protein [Streptomyces decoyicus]|uniref:ATP-binding protein n=1 Tax=Streptomyces decoyicus TaxID=249567 RepID=A0ABZ1FMI9_9ACTN|nr:ATP-binding protein [Streptomyces decoyicus]WSB71653.1 ATP-binding protein [Streptomyces decoyicus]
MSVQATSRAPQASVTVRVFTMRFSATRLGARLARRLAVHRLHQWGYGSELSDSAAVVVAELAANAVTHGRVPGRDFELRLATLSYADTGADAARPATLRIEVADTRTEKLPPSPEKLASPPPDCETGRGLPLVAALAARWEVVDRAPVGKVVRAELDL